MDEITIIGKSCQTIHKTPMVIGLGNLLNLVDRIPKMKMLPDKYFTKKGQIGLSIHTNLHNNIRIPLYP